MTEGGLCQEKDTVNQRGSGLILDKKLYVSLMRNVNVKGMWEEPLNLMSMCKCGSCKTPVCLASRRDSWILVRARAKVLLLW